jgi:uncharacterized protein (TIGR02147 family)
VNIYSYMDFREFMRKWVEQYRKTNQLTNREIGRRLGVGSPSYYSDVFLKDKKIPSVKVAEKIAEMMKLSRKETEYLFLMIDLKRVKTDIERTNIMEEMLKYWKGASPDVHVLERNEINFMSEWQNAVLFELIPLLNKFGNRNSEERQDVIRKLRPNITETQINKAIELLESMKFIAKDKKGNYVKTDKILRGDKPYFIINTLSKLVNIGNRIVGVTKPEHRQFRSLFLPVSEEVYTIMQKRIDTFCQDLIDITRKASKKADRLYNMNLQFFPLTRFEDGKEQSHSGP